VLTGRQIRERFPALSPEDDTVGVYEPRAGVLFPERCIAAYLERARLAGARIRLNEKVLGFERVHSEAGESLIQIATDQGQYQARRLIVTAGAYVQDLFPAFKLPLQCTRQVLHWFAPLREARDFGPERLPVYLWQFDGHRMFYGFPDTGEGVKVAIHHGGLPTSPHALNRSVSELEKSEMREILARRLPNAAGEYRSSAVCMYTNTPDEHFWIDRAPGSPDILIASPCSGHGFKFAAAMGEILSNEIQDRQTPGLDLALFRSRF